MRKISNDNLYKYVLFLSAKDISGGNITPESWNLILPIMVNQIVLKYYGNPNKYSPGVPMPPVSYEITQLVTDYLRHLKVPKLIALDQTGNFKTPEDYLHHSSAAVTTLEKKVVQELIGKELGCCATDNTPIDSTVVYEENFKPVTFVTDKEQWTYQNSTILKPTAEYPIGIFMNEDNVQIYPRSIKSVYYTYIRYPQTPVWNYTIVDGSPVYNPVGTVDIELPDIIADELACTILERLGLSIRENALIDYGRFTKNS